MDWDDIPKDIQPILSLVAIIIILFMLEGFIQVTNFIKINYMYVIGIVGIAVVVGTFIKIYPILSTSKIDEKKIENIIKSNDVITSDSNNVDTKVIKNNSKKTKKRDSNYEYLNKLRKSLKDFKPIETKKGSYNESVLEAQLFQQLSVQFGKENVKFQAPSKSGRVDLLINNKYAIELKLASSKKQLESAFLQFLNYAKEYENLFVLIHDINKKLQNNDVKKFKKQFYEIGQNNIEFIITY